MDPDSTILQSDIAVSSAVTETATMEPETTSPPCQGRNATSQAPGNVTSNTTDGTRRRNARGQFTRKETVKEQELVLTTKINQDDIENFAVLDGGLDNRDITLKPPINHGDPASMSLLYFSHDRSDPLEMRHHDYAIVKGRRCAVAACSESAWNAGRRCMCDNRQDRGYMYTLHHIHCPIVQRTSKKLDHSLDYCDYVLERSVKKLNAEHKDTEI